jgi:PleD family two-component response regulator
MGATVFDPGDQTAGVECLLAVADQALYAAKGSGRNRVVFRRADCPDPGPDSPPEPSSHSL